MSQLAKPTQGYRAQDLAKLPDSAARHLHTAPEAVRALDVHNTLEGGDRLPNFLLPIREPFAQLEE